MEESRQDMKIDSGVYPLYDRVRQDHAVSVYIGEQNKSMKALARMPMRRILRCARAGSTTSATS